MDKVSFELKMAEHQKKFDVLIDEINADVIKFADSNPEATTYDLNTTSNFIDYGVESFGWISDKINGTLRTEKPKKSLVSKLRKVLGYTLP